MRRFLAICIATPFAAMCIYDLTHGRIKTGVLAGLFCIANAIIYW